MSPHEPARLTGELLGVPKGQAAADEVRPTPQVAPLPPDTDTAALMLRIPRRMHEALRRRAFDERRAIAELVREALANYLR